VYQYREVKLTNRSAEKGILVIEFDDPAMQVIGEFLMADGSLLGDTVLQEIEAIHQGEKQEAQLSGNRCGIVLTKTATTINDLLLERYEDVTGGPEYTIDTETFRKILTEWLEVKSAFYDKKP